MKIRLNSVVLGDAGNHDCGIGGNGSGIGGDPQSVGRKLLVGAGIVIPADQVEALLAQTLRYRRTHPAQTDNSNFHALLPNEAAIGVRSKRRR